MRGAFIAGVVAQDLFLGPMGSGQLQTGLMYEGWHAPAYWGMGTRNLTVEQVIRSNGGLKVGDMRTGWSPSMSMNFYWHKQPETGFYCIYRKRPGEQPAFGMPDCPGITETLKRHAQMLDDVGVDFIVADSTNIQSQGEAADALQLRPFEVLAEEWLALRSAGVATPKIAVWQNLQDPAGNLWQAYVSGNGAYVNPAYDDLIFKDGSGRKVFFTTASPTAALVTEIQKLGIVVVTMWAERDRFAQGEWAFFSPCMAGGRAFTTSVYSDPSVPCNQAATTGSPIGNALTVSPSYQLSYSSLPFQASGKLGGLTLRKQFETAFAMHAQGTLDYLFVGTFNEHVAQPQANPYSSNPAAVSMGLDGDADAGSLWVDMFGDGITRDLEPTLEDAGAAWKLFQSCMRVLRSSGSCAGSKEICCVLDPQAKWVNVWSLSNGNDHLLTVDANERSVLTTSGWKEICAPFGGASAFCATSDPPVSDYHRSPFLIYQVPLASGDSAPVHRCLSAESTHFISGDPSCRGAGTSESILGYASTKRSSETPRQLALCFAAGAFRVSVGGACDGDQVLEQLGFVH